jgi:hypothetical protein
VYVTTTGERTGAKRVLVAILKERDLFEDQGIEGRMILKCILKKQLAGSRELERSGLE